MTKERIFLASITHNGLIDHRMARSYYVTASRDYEIEWGMKQTSLLAGGCNELWCKALNNRVKNNLKWFALLHADIVPEAWWLDKMVAIADQHGADLLSAVVPIKDSNGVTSTALASVESDFIRYTRLTQRQLWHQTFPETFDVDAAVRALQQLPRDLNMVVPTPTKLLVNTGCMICRIDQPWSDEIHFTINDRIERLFNQYIAQVEPEDWFFSRKVAESGGKVMATKLVKVEHIGATAFRSDSVWGADKDPAAL